MKNQLKILLLLSSLCISGKCIAQKEKEFLSYISMGGRQWLIDNGIPSSRIEFKGYGDEKPIASNSTKEGKAANRRVEIVLGN